MLVWVDHLARVSLMKDHCLAASVREAGPEGGMERKTGWVSPARRTVSMKTMPTLESVPGISNSYTKSIMRCCNGELVKYTIIHWGGSNCKQLVLG